ncbi:MAG: hypothetical protein PHS57_08745 [Alphaproteobacteria bacterium]|nr:hypothetical protein [Alphaproteobacteria bacterium]
MKRFYWESVMKRVSYDSDALTRQKCIIYEVGNSDPIAECWDVGVAELVVNSMNKSVEER